MTLKEFAQQIKDEHPTLSQCYIAVMDIDGQYDLEVEVSEDTIGGVYRTEESNLETARSLADELEEHLDTLGINVAATRQIWESYLER